MSVKKVGKVWSFRIEANLDPRTGKRKQIYRSGFSSKKEALEEMYKLQMEVMTGTYNEPTKHLFKDFILNWLHGTYKHEVQSTSFERAEASVRNHLIPYFQATSLDKITTYEIDQLYAQKLQARLANATPPSIKRKMKQLWSVEEAKTFLEVCEQENYLIPFLLAIFTGMRRGEILALRWKNVDLNKSVIHVEESLARTKAEGLFVKEVKTSHSERDVFLSPSLQKALADYKSKQEEHPMNLVFPSKNGTYLEPRNLLRKYKVLIKQAKVPYIPFHNLRHTHATILMRMRENPKVVSERLGHARVGITLDIYSHTNEEMQKKTAERFDDNFWT